MCAQLTVILNFGIQRLQKQNNYSCAAIHFRFLYRLVCRHIVLLLFFIKNKSEKGFVEDGKDVKL